MLPVTMVSFFKSKKTTFRSVFANKSVFNLHFMKVSTENDNNFGYEKITIVVQNIPLSVCTNPEKWVVMYLYVRSILSLSTILLLNSSDRVVYLVVSPHFIHSNETVNMTIWCVYINMPNVIYMVGNGSMLNRTI